MRRSERLVLPRFRFVPRVTFIPCAGSALAAAPRAGWTRPGGACRRVGLGPPQTLVYRRAPRLLTTADRGRRIRFDYQAEEGAFFVAAMTLRQGLHAQVDGQAGPVFPPPPAKAGCSFPRRSTGSSSGIATRRAARRRGQPGGTDRGNPPLSLPAAPLLRNMRSVGSHGLPAEPIRCRTATGSGWCGLGREPPLACFKQRALRQPRHRTSSTSPALRLRQLAAFGLAVIGTLGCTAASPC